MKFLARATLILLLVGAAGVFVVFMVRDAVATRVVRSALSERGIACAPLLLSLDTLLKKAAVEPTSCVLVKGDIERVGFSEGFHAELSWGRPARIVLPLVELTQRSGEDPPDVRGLLSGEVPERLRSLLVRLAAWSRERNPPTFQVERLRISGASRVVEVRELDLDPREDHLAVSLSSLAPPARPTSHGPELQGGLVNVRGRATASQVTLSGYIDFEMELARVDVKRAIPVQLIGRGLDGPSPRYEVRLGPSDGLERLRALRQRATSGRPRPEDIEQGVRSVLQRSQERREARRTRRGGPLLPPLPPVP